MRSFITLMLFLMGFSFTTPALATTDKAARDFVDQLGEQVLGTINAGGSESEKQTRLQQMFEQYVDIPWMGQFVLGRATQKATPQQRERYTQAYRNYLLARYTTNFADYTGAKYTITGVRSEGEGQFTVTMQIKTPDQNQSTEAGYRLRTDNGQFKIVDIIVEGVSMITTQRSEFSSVVQREGMDGLISSLEQKAQEERTA